MSVPPDQMNETRFAKAAGNGSTYDWKLTTTSLNSPVTLIVQQRVLPVIFVPGIMGSNLMDLKGKQVWRLDTTMGQPIGLARKMAFSGPATRQRLMHPSRTRVDPGGSVPKALGGSVSTREQYRDQRFWGEIAEGSYHAFLLWLEQRLNGQGMNPARWDDFYYTSVSAMPKPGERRPEPKLQPGVDMRMKSGFNPNLHLDASAGRIAAETVKTDDVLARAAFHMPVYACGYNWLDSADEAAVRLKSRIAAVIAANNTGFRKCNQVLLVTHSMGGLVARRCAKLEGVSAKIAGVVHGVMPAVGAAVAYRRCKVGMREESFVAGLVIGSNGHETTAVFAQAPGALQLLPTAQYKSKWLSIRDARGRELQAHPEGCPYSDIYIRLDHWWGLVRKEWLSPKDGMPITWDEFKLNNLVARNFHLKIKDYYHHNTYVYYGADEAHPSFEKVVWKITRGTYSPDTDAAPPVEGVPNLRFSDVRDDGTNPARVGGKLEVVSGYMAAHTYQSSHWDLNAEMQDGAGDGTVPVSSGSAPLFLSGKAAGIKQQFRLTRFEHEQSYNHASARSATLFSIYRIAGSARKDA